MASIVGSTVRSVKNFLWTAQNALELNPATLSGAIDIVVIRHTDDDESDSFVSTPFHVRFGKLQLLKSAERYEVTICVNGEEVDFRMKLGRAGEAYFVEECDGEDIGDWISPISSPESGPLDSPTDDEKVDSLPALNPPPDPDLELQPDPGPSPLSEPILRSHNQRSLSPPPRLSYQSAPVRDMRATASDIGDYSSSTPDLIWWSWEWGNLPIQEPRLNNPRHLTTRASVPHLDSRHQLSQRKQNLTAYRSHSQSDIYSPRPPTTRSAPGSAQQPGWKFSSFLPRLWGKKDSGKLTGESGLTSLSALEVLGGEVDNLGDLQHESDQRDPETPLAGPEGDLLSRFGASGDDTRSDAEANDGNKTVIDIFDDEEAKQTSQEDVVTNDISVQIEDPLVTILSEASTADGDECAPSQVTFFDDSSDLTREEDQEQQETQSTISASKSDADTDKASPLSAEASDSNADVEEPHPQDVPDPDLDDTDIPVDLPPLLSSSDIADTELAKSAPPSVHLTAQQVKHAPGTGSPNFPALEGPVSPLSDVGSGSPLRHNEIGRPESPPPHILDPRNSGTFQTPRSFDRNYEAMHRRPLMGDLEMSLCGDLLDSDMERSRQAFLSNLVTYEQLCENPQLIFSGNLILQWEGKLYPGEVAVPLILSYMAFGKPLDQTAMENLSELKAYEHLHFGSARKNQPRRGLFSWLSTPKPDEQDQRPQPSRTSPHTSPLPTPISPRSRPLSPHQSSTSPKKRFRKSLRPTSEMLKSLNLHPGKNLIKFSVTSTLQGTQTVEASLFLWDSDSKIVVTDVDGTITKSDVVGNIAPLFGADWSHSGVAKLFSSIKKNGYQVLYLTSRAIGQANITRNYIFGLAQRGHQEKEVHSMPDGPIIMSPEGLVPSFKREVIHRRPQDFKIPALRDVSNLFDDPTRTTSPFYAGFGNRPTDMESYLAVGVPEKRIFIINPSGEVSHFNKAFRATYPYIYDAVFEFFPFREIDSKTGRIKSAEVEEEFRSFMFWREPVRNVDDLESLLGDESSQDRTSIYGSGSDTESENDVVDTTHT